MKFLEHGKSLRMRCQNPPPSNLNKTANRKPFDFLNDFWPSKTNLAKPPQCAVFLGQVCPSSSQRFPCFVQWEILRLPPEVWTPPRRRQSVEVLISPLWKGDRHVTQKGRFAVSPPLWWPTQIVSNRVCWAWHMAGFKLLHQHLLHYYSKLCAQKVQARARSCQSFRSANATIESDWILISKRPWGILAFHNFSATTIARASTVPCDADEPFSKPSISASLSDTLEAKCCYQRAIENQVASKCLRGSICCQRHLCHLAGFQVEDTHRYCCCLLQVCL